MVIVVGALSIAWAVANAPVVQVERYTSCKDCRSLRCVTERSVYGFQFGSSEEIRARASISTEHVHHWWEYHTHTVSGDEETWSCGSARYEDGKDY